MSAVALLESNANPTDDDINRAMSGNVCRCGMYGRIRSAIKGAVKLTAAGEVAIYDPKASATQASATKAPLTKGAPQNG